MRKKRERDRRKGLGAIHPESLPPKLAGGNRCTVRLPLSATRLRESGPPLPTGHSLLAKESGAPPELHGLRVLVVDDEEDARDMLRTLLESCGAQVRLASSVEEGLHELTCEPPDVLLSDIGMPGQDGYTFMERVRKLPRERGGATCPQWP